MKKNGFTLIELMIIVAIVGILFAFIVGPSKHKEIEKDHDEISRTK